MGGAGGLGALLEAVRDAAPEEVDEVAVADAVEGLDAAAVPPGEDAGTHRLHVDGKGLPVHDRDEALGGLAEVRLPAPDEADHARRQGPSASQGSGAAASAPRRPAGARRRAASAAATASGGGPSAGRGPERCSSMKPVCRAPARKAG